MHRSSKSPALVFSVCVFCAQAALGHGAPPRAADVVQQPGVPAVRAVSTTFGALVTRDQGATFRWICEETLGLAEGEAPVLHLTPTGTLLVGSFEGLLRSTNGGCDFTAEPAFATTGASSFAQSGDASFVTTSRFGQTNGLFVSHDDGATFTATTLADPALFFSSVKVAPSRAQRVYVGAWYHQPVSDALFVSDDGAQSFTRIDLDGGLPTGGPFVVQAVHPTQPDVLLASVTSSAAPAHSYLVRSEDQGASFTAVLDANEPFSQAAFDPNGQGAWAASGGTVYRSDDGARTFTALSSPTRDACVRVIDGQPFVCGNTSADGYVVAALDGAAPLPWLTWPKLAGVVSCNGGGGTKAACGPYYPAQLTELGLDPSYAGPDGGVDANPPEGCGCGATAGAPALILAAAIFVSLRRGRRFARSP